MMEHFAIRTRSTKRITIDLSLLAKTRRAIGIFGEKTAFE